MHSSRTAASLHSTLVANIPHTGKTCDGAQIDVTCYPSLKIMPEPSCSFGLQAGLDASADTSLGYQFELGAAGDVPPGEPGY